MIINYCKKEYEVSEKEFYVWYKFWDSVNNTHNYNILNNEESEIIRNIYKRMIDKINVPIYIDDFNILTKEIDRIVIGNHGPYIEFSNPECKLEIKKGQEYRLSDGFKNKVKYIWLNPIGFPEIKIYKQTGIVKYADYKIGKYYVSPFDLKNLT